MQEWSKDGTGCITVLHYFHTHTCTLQSFVFGLQGTEFIQTSNNPSSGRSVQWTAFLTLSTPNSALRVRGRRCLAISCQQQRTEMLSLIKCKLSQINNQSIIILDFFCFQKMLNFLFYTSIIFVA